VRGRFFVLRAGGNASSWRGQRDSFYTIVDHPDPLRSVDISRRQFFPREFASVVVQDSVRNPDTLPQAYRGRFGSVV